MFSVRKFLCKALQRLYGVRFILITRHDTLKLLENLFLQDSHYAHGRPQPPG